MYTVEHTRNILASHRGCVVFERDFAQLKNSQQKYIQNEMLIFARSVLDKTDIHREVLAAWIYLLVQVLVSRWVLRSMLMLFGYLQALKEH